MSDRVKRMTRLLFWRRIAASAVFDAILVFCLLCIADDAYDPGVQIHEVVIGVGLIWIVDLLLSFRGWAWTTLSMVLVEPKLTEEAALEVLRENQLPWPNWVPGRFTGLAEIANDNTLSNDVRLRAAILLNVWKTIFSWRKASGGFVLETAWDKAAARYAQEQPRAPRPSEYDDDDT